MASRQFLPFQRKWNDDQISFVLANQHMDARSLADLHNARFPDLEEMNATQARSNVVRWRNHPRFNPQVTAANAAAAAVVGVGGAGTTGGIATTTAARTAAGVGSGGFGAATAPGPASAGGRAQYAEQEDDGNDDGSLFGSPSVPGSPTMPVPQLGSNTVAGPAYPAPATTWDGQPAQPYAAAAAGYGVLPGTQCQAFQPLQPLPPNSPASYYPSRRRSQPPQQQQQYGDAPTARQLNGHQYHSGPHAGCAVAGPHRHAADGELCFPSAAVFAAVLERHAAADAAAAAAVGGRSPAQLEQQQTRRHPAAAAPEEDEDPRNSPHVPVRRAREPSRGGGRRWPSRDPLGGRRSSSPRP